MLIRNFYLVKTLLLQFLRKVLLHLVFAVYQENVFKLCLIILSNGVHQIFMVAMGA